MSRVSISSYYGNSSSAQNNAKSIEIGAHIFYFSYKTVIAFWAPDQGLVVRQNNWGPTTGKHLNAVNADKSRRIPGEEFEKLLSKISVSVEG